MNTNPFLHRAITVFLWWCAVSIQTNFAATITSIAPGDWNSPGTWDSGVPGSMDDVVINHAVLLDISPTVASLLVTGVSGSLAGPFAINVTGALAIESAGALSNTGNVTAGSVSINYGGAAINSTGDVTTAGPLSIGFSGTLSNTGNVVAGSVNLEFSGALTNTGNVTVAGLLSVGYASTLNNGGDATAGSMNIGNYQPTIGGTGAAGTVTVNGASTIDLGTDSYNGFLVGKTLVLKGATNKGKGQFYVQAGALLRNAATLTLNHVSAFGFNGDNTGSIDNLGSIVKSAPGTILFERALFNNSGTVQITGGTIELQGTGGSFTAGSVAIGSGASLKMVGLSGPATYDLTGGSVTGLGKMEVGSNVVATFSGSATFSANMEIAAGGAVADNRSPGLTPRNLTLLGGTYGGTGAGISGNITLDGGLFNPNGNATVAGLLNFLAGSIGDAASTVGTTVTVAGLADIGTNAGKDLFKKELICNSGANCSASVALHTGTLTIPSGKMLNCTAAAGDITLGHPDGGTLKLSGTLNKTGGDNLFLEKLAVINNGAMNLNAGVTLFSGDNAIDHTGNGSIAVAAGASLKRLTGPNASLNYRAATFSNNGVLEDFDLKFSGTSGQQTLAGNGTAHGLTINNPAGLDITGGQTVTDIFSFLVDAKVLLHGSDLNLTSGQTPNGGPARYFVTQGLGKLVMQIAGSSTGIFHVGPGTSNYNPISISTAPSDASTFGIRAQVGFDMDKPIGTEGYVNRQWQIDRDGGTLGVGLVFQWNMPGDVAGSFTSGNCHVSHWNGTAWESFANAAATCASGTCTRAQGGVTDFSPFAVASGVVLPIELKSFRGFAAGMANHFEWETAVESNTKSDYLQRSPDGLSGWATVAERAAAGNSNVPVSYSADDPQPPVAAYYRVVFEDLDGKTASSPIVFIERDDASGGQFSVFPNPVGADGFWLRAPLAAAEQPLTVRIFDVMGHLVVFREIEPLAGAPVFFMENQLSAGAYSLKISSGATAQTLSFVVK